MVTYSAYKRDWGEDGPNASQLFILPNGSTAIKLMETYFLSHDPLGFIHSPFSPIVAVFVCVSLGDPQSQNINFWKPQKFITALALHASALARLAL